jgi:hypothetical protein
MRAAILILLLSVHVGAVSYRELLNTDSMIYRVDDGAFIPKDIENRDYDEFLEWQNRGNRILPPPPLPEKTPREILKEQARSVLKDSNATNTEKIRALILLLDLDEGTTVISPTR